MKKFLALILALCMALSLVACGAASDGDDADVEGDVSAEDYGTIPAHLSIGTVPAGQAYYTMGAGIADLVNKANIGTTVVAEETSGMPVNVQLMMNGEIELAFINNLMAAQAYTATSSYSEYEAGKVLSVMTMAPTEMHIAVPADSDIESIYDFAGKRVGVGQPGGIALEVTNMFLEAIGYKDGDFERLEINLQNQCDYMQDGQLDVLIWIGSAPLAAVTGLIATKELRFLDIDDDAVAKMQAVCPEAEKCTIAANSYSGQTEEVASFCLRGILVASADLSNEAVYQITKLIMENVETLGNVHASMKSISPETVTLGMSENTPLHPGAQRYYEEIGMDVSAFALN